MSVEISERCKGENMKITREDVLRVAQLAHLDLSPDEVETYRGQLDEILTYIGKLEQLDVSNVEPMSQVLPRAEHDVANPRPQQETDLRDDVVGPCNIADAVLAQAPDASKPFFRVPKVIER
jgi:aspartyl-tRNA(Asn)/glutamyl-tRNA(Gln) amidotransferase subunit C